MGLALPAKRGKKVEAVAGQAFGEPVLEILVPAIEAPDLLYGPRPFEIEVRLSDRASRLAKRGDDGNFGGADLKGEQEEAEDKDQQQADNESQWIAFHDS